MAYERYLDERGRRLFDRIVAQLDIDNIDPLGNDYIYDINGTPEWSFATRTFVEYFRRLNPNTRDPLYDAGYERFWQYLYQNFRDAVGPHAAAVLQEGGRNNVMEEMYNWVEANPEVLDHYVPDRLFDDPTELLQGFHDDPFAEAAYLGTPLDRVTGTFFHEDPPSDWDEVAGGFIEEDSDDDWAEMEYSEEQLPDDEMIAMAEDYEDEAELGLFEGEPIFKKFRPDE